LAADYEASGLTREAFCQQRDLPLKTLCRYVTRYRHEKAGTMQSPRLVQVEVTAPAASAARCQFFFPADVASKLAAALTLARFVN
jgi:hypothetical protein